MRQSGVYMRVDGLVFDKDGTLFSFHETWSAWAEGFLAELCAGDQTRMQVIAQVIGFDLGAKKFAKDSIVVADTPDQIAQVLLPYFDLSLPELVAYLNAQAALAPQFPAIALPPFLQALKAQGLKLGLATNDAESAALAHLDQAGIRGFFDYIVGYDTGHGSKPAPGQCQGFLAATGLAAARVAMVGDSVHDLVAGRAAGMQVVGVLTGVAGATELAPYADIILPDIGHLAEWIKG